MTGALSLKRKTNAKPTQNQRKTNAMKRIQIHSQSDTENILRAAGVRRVHHGWYTVEFRSPVLDRSTVCSARRNPKGEIRA